jgi:hypothetical protein
MTATIAKMTTAKSVNGFFIACILLSARKGAGRGLSRGAPLRILSRLSHPATGGSRVA